MEQGKKESAGVITAFFSMVMLLVIVLITTMAETARVSACSQMSKTFLELGTKSILGSYYLPLFENYHVFGRWIREEEKEQVLSEELRWYLEQNMSGVTWMNQNPGEVSVNRMAVLTQNNGAPFFEQVLQYMKYKGVQMAAEEVLAATGLMDQMEEDVLAVQHRMESGAAAAQAETTLLQLFGCVDGFEIEEGNIAVNWRGQLKLADSFAKKLLAGEVSEERTIAGRDELYLRQKNNYMDSQESCDFILDLYNHVQEGETRLDELKSQAAMLTENLTMKEELELVYQTEEWQKLQEQIFVEEQQIEQNLMGCKERSWSLSWAVTTTLAASERALELLAQIEMQRKEAIAELMEFESWLEGKKGVISEELFEELSAENEKMTALFYEENGFGMLRDSSAFVQALEHNIEILRQAEEQKLGEYRWGEDEALQQEKEPTGTDRVKACKELLAGLDTKTLCFDYSQINLSKGEGGYASFFTELAQYGLAGLVTGKEEGISHGEISLYAPSLDYDGEAEDEGMTLSALVDSLREGTLADSLKLLGEFALQEGEELTEDLLFLGYLTEHFGHYGNVSEAEAETFETLAGICYQQEYILCGKTLDVSNLSSILTRIFLIRFLVCFPALFSSQECRAKLEAAAVGIAGFTGIGALIMVTKILIAMLWAAECALVETAVLIRGGETGFVTAASRLPIAFEELLLFSPQMLEQKAMAGSELAVAGWLKNYEQYLTLFLLLEKRDLRTLRTMDIIQQQISLNYEEGFRLQDCIYMLSAELKTVIPARFLASPPGAENYEKTSSYAASY